MQSNTGPFLANLELIIGVIEEGNRAQKELIKYAERKASDEMGFEIRYDKKRNALVYDNKESNSVVDYIPNWFIRIQEILKRCCNE